MFKQFIQKFFSKTNLILYAIIIVLIALDLVTKHIVQVKIALGESVSFLPGIMDFTFTLNKGAAWSMFSSLENATIVLGIVSVVFAVLCLVVNYFIKKGKNLLYYFGFCLTLAGTLGNAYDRIFLGAVRDFLKTTFISFPIFNIADMCLVVGLILICVWYLILAFKSDAKNQKDDVTQGNFDKSSNIIEKEDDVADEQKATKDEQSEKVKNE